MVLVESLLLGAHALVLRPRLGDHHHDGVRERASGEHEQFEAIVEHGGIAAIGIDDRQDLFDVVAEEIGFEQRLACVHPVDVAAQGVDFAVVRHVAVRMGAIPAWKVFVLNREWTSASALVIAGWARSG